MINVAIAEDISKIAEALKQKIELSQEFSVKKIAKNGKEIIEFVAKNRRIDVIIMDINMPEVNGIEATEKISQLYPEIKIIMSTVFDDEQYLFDAVMAGASGYLLKDEPAKKLHKSIYEALEGGAPMSKLIAHKSLLLIKRSNKRNIIEADYKLTTRETEVLEFLSKGLSYNQVSDHLYISYGTVRKHVENIYRKMKVHNKIEAIENAKQRGLI